jgi:deoxyribose-phosphate aldolase
VNINTTIEHTLLKPQATQEDIEVLCREAMENSFAGVCVSPVYVQKCVEILKDSDVRCVSVVGFSSGAFLTETKVEEARRIVELGANEVDMVMAIWALKNRDNNKVIEDIKMVRKAILKQNPQSALKVIIETALLSDDEKKIACELCLKAGADFVKTSTGAFEGASVEDVNLIKSCVGDQAQIKASGGIRNFEFAQKLIKAGAVRLGTSAGIEISAGKDSTTSY